MAGENFPKLVELMARLRGPGGCPWDREQTFDTMLPYITEESQELVDGIRKRDFENVKEELGDVLLHIVMLSGMAEEQKLFTLDDVVKEISDKMIRRHPHVFGDVKADSVEDVLKNWKKIKKKEKSKPTEL